VSTTERIYALLVAANPIPDPDTQSDPVAETRPHLRLVDPRRTVMQTQHQPQHTSPTESKQPRRLRPAWIYAVAAFILVAAVGATAWMLQSDSDEGPAVASPVATTPDAAVAAATPATEIPAEIPDYFVMPLPSDYEALVTREGSNISGARQHFDVRVGFEIPADDLEAVVAMYEDWFKAEGIDPDTQRFSTTQGTTVTIKQGWPPGSTLADAGAGTVTMSTTSTGDETATVELAMFTYVISDNEYQQWRIDTGLIDE